MTFEVLRVGPEPGVIVKSEALPIEVAEEASVG
jgi:hypothetical protein